jgi:hypothetical protein
MAIMLITLDGNTYRVDSVYDLECFLHGWRFIGYGAIWPYRIDAALRPWKRPVRMYAR